MGKDGNQFLRVPAYLWFQFQRIAAVRQISRKWNLQ